MQKWWLWRERQKIAKASDPWLSRARSKGQTRRSSSGKGQFAQHVGCRGTVKRSSTRAKICPNPKFGLHPAELGVVLESA